MDSGSPYTAAVDENTSRRGPSAIIASSSDSVDAVLRERTSPGASSTRRLLIRAGEMHYPVEGGVPSPWRTRKSARSRPSVAGASPSTNSRPPPEAHSRRPWLRLSKTTGWCPRLANNPETVPPMYPAPPVTNILTKKTPRSEQIYVTFSLLHMPKVVWSKGSPHRTVNKQSCDSWSSGLRTLRQEACRPEDRLPEFDIGAA